MAKTPSGTRGKPRKPALSSKPARKPRAAAAKVAVAGTGPVTLEEAQALARAKQPTLALRAARSAVAEPTSPEAIARERNERDKRAKAELDRRIRDYKATMAIMKKRGARAPGARTGDKRIAAAPQAAAFVPLQVVAEGDSWFDYPIPLFGGGIVKRLQPKLGVPILDLSDAGDEVRFMLGVEQRILLAQHLAAGCPAGGPWDALLFSGGGNDIADNPMALWIRDWDPALPPSAHIHQPRFGMALALVRAGYEDLIALRDGLSPGTHLVFHGYDFAIPDGRGVCGFGPWLKPTFDLRKFPPAIAPRQAVVKEMLLQFAAMLESLVTPTNKVTVIKTQGTLQASTSAWHNELHPSKTGFQKFADIFHQKLKALFPNRVA
jgi:hypothetical protein